MSLVKFSVEFAYAEIEKTTIFSLPPFFKKRQLVHLPVFIIKKILKAFPFSNIEQGSDIQTLNGESRITKRHK